MARCWFCQADKKLSREHVLSDWIGKLTDTQSRPTRIQLGSNTYTAPPFSDRLRAPCIDCNSGWMSQMEEDAKAVLGSMILGQRQILDERAQFVAAAWCFKTTLTLDFATGTELYDRDACRWFHDARQPPPNMGIWLGAVKWETSLLRAWGGHTNTAPSTSGQETGNAMGYSMTFNVLNLVVHALGVDVPRQVLLDHTGEAHGSLIRVWPIVKTRIEWPPRLIFNERRLAALAQVGPGRPSRIPGDG